MTNNFHLNLPCLRMIAPPFWWWAVLCCSQNTFKDEWKVPWLCLQAVNDQVKVKIPVSETFRITRLCVLADRVTLKHPIRTATHGLRHANRCNFLSLLSPIIKTLYCVTHHRPTAAGFLLAPEVCFCAAALSLFTAACVFPTRCTTDAQPCTHIYVCLYIHSYFRHRDNKITWKTQQINQCIQFRLVMVLAHEYFLYSGLGGLLCKRFLIQFLVKKWN